MDNFSDDSSDEDNEVSSAEVTGLINSAKKKVRSLFQWVLLKVFALRDLPPHQ